jgi:hypothetical protein
VNDEFAAALADRPPGRFGHADHLYVAWRLVREQGHARGSELFTDGLRSLAEEHGQAAKYHQTLTDFWLALVVHAVGLRPELDDFEAFLEAFPLLRDSSLARRHWSDDVLWSESARRGWLAPDLLPLGF